MFIMKNFVWVLSAAMLFLIASCGGQQSSEVSLKTELDSASYVIGLSLGKSLKEANHIDEIELDIVKKGIEAVYSDEELLFSDQEINSFLTTYFTKQRDLHSQGNLQEGIDFLAENKEKEGVQVTESGLQYKVIEEGTGATPALEDTVRCHYRGTLINGEVFESSYEQGEPAKFPVNGVIQGWQEALQMMKEGAVWELYLPTELGYGKRVRPGGPIEPNMALIFEIELLEITSK